MYNPQSVNKPSAAYYYTLIGGILALTYHPFNGTSLYSSSQPPYSPLIGIAATKYCPKCGKQLPP